MKKIILASALLATMAQAEMTYEGTSVGVQAAIFGLGATVKGKLNDNLGVRASFDTFSVDDYEVEDDEVKYNFDLDLKDFMLLGDYHPWEGSFKLSAGMIINNSVLDGTITPNTRDADKIEFDFNNKHYVYSVSEIGAIETKVDFDPVAPYIGFGWDTSFDKKSGFGFTFDLGIAYQGAAQATYKIKYGEALDPEKATADIEDPILKQQAIAEIEARQKEIKDELEKELDKEMISLQDELDKYEWMPYISIGFNYKF